MKMMKTDTEIRFEGIRALMQVLGTVEAQRFIALINHAPRTLNLAP
jgi:hypothetical protein